MSQKSSELRVDLLCNTPDPDRVVAAAASLCYGGAPAHDLVAREYRAEEAGRYIGMLRRSGHHSVFEHAVFSFSVEGLSRVSSHQLVRHRIASFSQQSQRYVRMKTPDVVVPPSIAADAENARLFEETALAVHDVYRRLCERGVPKEDARYILPHGWSTQLVVTMNARELHHFFALRLCRRAQWEIRDLARAMLRLARGVAPILFETAGPGCLTGRCEEERPCGRPFANMEELLYEGNLEAELPAAGNGASLD